MRYPNPLVKGSTIGVCAPSSGVTGGFITRFENAVNNLKNLGFIIIETDSVRQNKKCVSNDAFTRAEEFKSLYFNEAIDAIYPPWGGEFLMEILPLLDFDQIRKAKPKWIIGYSDISTILFTMTLLCDISTCHGPCLLDLGSRMICESDLRLFSFLKEKAFTQYSLQSYQTEWSNIEIDPLHQYHLTERSEWKLLNGTSCTFSGRLIGGCLDTICILIGTPYGAINSFLETYKDDGFIWYLESCEMNAGDIYRTLWQMKCANFFKYCKGFIFGRAAGYSDTSDFNLLDALSLGIGEFNVPIIYDVDLGHLPPQLTFMNGAFAHVEYLNHQGTIIQELK